jgi:CubicO group peptidase (beta-lactamase class C family)
VIDGVCDAAFTDVRDVFAANLSSGDDLGAAVTVFVDGRCVVDLWGGLADERAGRPWARDTVAVTFSATKAVTAAAALLLVERGRLDVADRVAEHWPEFAAHGKGAITVEQVLSHQAGLPAFDRPISAAEAADGAAMAAQLAGQAPEWAPGSAHGYHALTFGWLVGELVRRGSGRPVARFVAEEFGPDLHLGGPDLAGLDPPIDVARLAAGRPLKAADRIADERTVAELVRASGDPSSPLQRSTANPAASFNQPVVLAGGWPAAGLVCTARALADFYRRLVDGTLLARGTVREAIRERVRGPDRTLVLESAFGLGFMRPSASEWLPPVAREHAFGHPGASGALGLGDLEAGVAFGYVPNLTHPALGDRRAYRLVEAVYAALG